MTEPKSPTPIAPALKAFMNRAMPEDKGGHVLALSSGHRQISQYQALNAHAEALVQDHNWGAFGAEKPPYMDVFAWAYRDGKLPVPKEDYANYMRTVFSKQSKIAFADAATKFADAEMAAIDHGVDVIHFDARYPLHERTVEHSKINDLLTKTFKNNKELCQQLRTNPRAFNGLAVRLCERNTEIARAVKAGRLTRDAVQDIAQNAFVLLEAKRLLENNPPYKRWLDNIEAVIEAGKKADIGEDALSAAILAASRDPAKNTITDSGIAHIMGAADKKFRNQGMFSAHLNKMGLPMTRAMFLDASELPSLRGFIRLYLMPRIHQAGLPEFQMPEIIPSGAMEEHTKFQRDYSAAQKHYAEKFKSDPKPRIYGVEYLERMHQKLQTPEMQRLLGKLREPCEQQTLSR